jgi:hypothetical protein
VAPIDELDKIFFAYPSKPEMRRETIVSAADAIGISGYVISVTWQDLGSPGRLAIEEILRAIDSSAVFACDITDLNQNVLFELGYAIGAKRRVWLTRDTTDENAARLWKQFGLLRSVYYLKYANSDQIVAGFERERPYRQVGTLYDDLIAPSLAPSTPTRLFYFKSLHDTNASRALTRAIEETLAGRSLVATDPIEGSLKPLGWYAQELHNTRAAIVHFTGEGRFDSRVHNARCALVAGLACGLGTPLLMLAEPGYEPPFDYQDLMYVYQNAKDCEQKASEWLAASLSAPQSASASPALSRGAEMASALKSLRLGSHIAEDERATLVDYFVETRNYLEVLGGATTVFVGRRGTGKTANFLRAAEELAGDKRNLVCAIKPPGYELDDVVRLLGSYRDQNQKGYMVESLWKYLLFTEIARAAAAEIRSRPVVPEPNSPEGQLLALASDPNGMLHEEFAVRLERGVRDLLATPTLQGVEERRIAISEALHEGVLRDLRDLLGRVLTGRRRVAVLVDNLDKGWDRDADRDVFSFFLLGLLGSIRQVASEFSKEDRWRRPVSVSLAVFLRSDIYSNVVKAARERDKLPVSELSWADHELLRRVIEDRYAATKDGQVDGSSIWANFVPTIKEIPTKEWLTRMILPRPRDLVFLCNAAITNAVNRRHQIVQEADLIDALEDYSHFAVDSIVVEGEVTIPRIEDILYEFVGSEALQSESEVRGRIDAARSSSDRTSDVLDFLVQVSFLGLQAGRNTYRFLQNLEEQRRLDALARRFASSRGRPGRTFMVHPAFWTYLAITGPDSSLAA